jgi:hypothetical protein
MIQPVYPFSALGSAGEISSALSGAWARRGLTLNGRRPLCFAPDDRRGRVRPTRPLPPVAAESVGGRCIPSEGTTNCASGAGRVTLAFCQAQLRRPA